MCPWAGAGLWMELDRECPQVRIVDALAGAVVGVDEAYLPTLTLSPSTA
mgnify:CR=1 FL=1